MRHPAFFSLLSSRQSWLARVRENLRQLAAPARLAPHSANGAPLHVLKINGSARRGRAQSLSLLGHAGAIAAILLLGAQVTSKRALSPEANSPGGNHTRMFIPLLDESVFGRPSEGRGSGGEHNPIPATRGDLPPRSSIQIVPPWMAHDSHPLLPRNPALLDPSALALAEVSPTDLGLPWMKEYTNSAGPGGPHGFGSTPGNTMGDGEPGIAGRGIASGPYARGVTQPRCQYCPDPAYSDEARKLKLQGIVLLEVLVSPDGRATQIRLTKGIGFGLDERAVESVRNWRFLAARDAAGRGVPAWVTVEVSFHLF